MFQATNPARETFYVDLIEASGIDNTFNPPSKLSCAIFSKSRVNRLTVSTARELIRVDRSNRVESTTFSTHPQCQVTLYFLSLAKINFRYDESTARETTICALISSFSSKNQLGVFPLPKGWGAIPSQGYTPCLSPTVTENISTLYHLIQKKFKPSALTHFTR